MTKLLRGYDKPTMPELQAVPGSLGRVLQEAMVIPRPGAHGHYIERWDLNWYVADPHEYHGDTSRWARKELPLGALLD